MDLTLKAVENYLSLKKPNDWIIGRGWIDKTWPEKRFPTRWDIDSFAPNNPVVLERADGHADSTLQQAWRQGRRRWWRVVHHQQHEQQQR